MKPGEMDKLILDYLMTFLGTPYVWGGASPQGIDCSGLVVEMLKARGWVTSKFDATAYDLYNKTLSGATSRARTLALAFFGKNQSASHVGICVNDFAMIEAGGGGSTTTSSELAHRQGAFVRLRPIFSRRDFLAFHIPDEIHFK